MLTGIISFMLAVLILFMAVICLGNLPSMSMDSFMGFIVLPFLVLSLAVKVFLKRSRHENQQNIMNSKVPKGAGSSASTDNCEVIFTGHETPKNLRAALPMMGGDDVMTLKWKGLNDTIQVIRENDQYLLAYCSPKKSYSYKGTLNLKITADLLAAFQQPDYMADAFWVYLNRKTPVAVYEEKQSQPESQSAHLKNNVAQRFEEDQLRHEDTNEASSDDFEGGDSISLCPKCNSELVVHPADIVCPTCDAPPKEYAVSPTDAQCPKCHSVLIICKAHMTCRVCDVPSSPVKSN